MNYTINDIRAVSDFADSLKKACAEILNGMPKNRALVKNNISITTFNTLMKNMSKDRKTAYAAKVIEETRHPSWQDDLIYDMCGDDSVFLPSDFEDELLDLEKIYLTDDQAEIINLYYIKKMDIQEIAAQKDVNAQTVREQRRRALRILGSHQEELFAGKEYINRFEELDTAYKGHCNALSWMRAGVRYIEQVSDDSDQSIADLHDISDEAKKYYRANGYMYLADVMKTDLKHLFVSLSRTVEKEGAFLSYTGNGKGILPETSLSSVGLRDKTVDAFNKAGYETVGDILSLDREKALSIPGVGCAQIVYLYSRVMFG